MASPEPRCPVGRKKEKSDLSASARVSLPDIDITNKILNFFSGSKKRHKKAQPHVVASRSSTLESHPKNKKRAVISSAKSTSSKKNIQCTTKSSRTSRQDSTSNVMDSSPFWSSSKQAMSRALWSPTKTDSLDSVSISLNVRSENMPRHSTWFSVKKIQTSVTRPNSQTISSQFVTSSWPRTTENEPLPCVEVDSKQNLTLPKTTPKALPAPVKATKIRLHVRNEQDRNSLHKILGTVRWTYNRCVDHLRTTKKTATKKELRSLFVNNTSEVVEANPWLLDVGYDIRDDAVKDFVTAMKGNFTKKTKGSIDAFDMRFRSKKRQKSETFYLRSRWIKQGRNLITLHLPKMGPITLWTGKRAWHGPILMDCKFQRTWTGEYYLCVPHAYRVENKDPPKSLRVCSLDPGVRTFQTIFDASNSCAVQISPGDIGRVYRLCFALDKLISKHDTTTSKKRKRNMQKAARRMRTRIQNLINEVHKQLAKYLITNYDLVMIPKFETSQMVLKSERNISSPTVRKMITWAHFRFRERLIFKSRQYGCKIAVVDEAWTSKTCSGCGKLDHKLGSKKIYSCVYCSMIMDRDINGAKNIFLKNYQALALELALRPNSCDSATGRCTETTLPLSLLNPTSFECFETFEEFRI